MYRVGLPQIRGGVLFRVRVTEFLALMLEMTLQLYELETQHNHVHIVLQAIQLYSRATLPRIELESFGNAVLRMQFRVSGNSRHWPPSAIARVYLLLGKSSGSIQRYC